MSIAELSIAELYQNPFNYMHSISELYQNPLHYALTILDLIKSGIETT